MKKFCVLCAAAVVALPLCARAATLSDSVSKAIMTHPAVVEKQALVDAADDNVREQKSAFFPVLGVNARFGRVSQDDDTTRAFTGGYATTWLGEEDVALTQPVFTGFANTRHLAAAKDRARAARFDLSGSSDDIAVRAARAHLNLMRTRELLDNASRYRDAIEGRKNSIDLMVKEGAGDQAEQLQAQEILMAARSTRLGYEEGFRQAEADYISVVGAAPDRMLEFGQPMWDRLIPPTVAAAVEQATRDNPQVKSAEAIVAAAGNDTAADRSTLMPRLDAEVSGALRDQHEELGGEFKNVQGMMKLSWNFATGGGQSAHIHKDLNLRRQAAARRDDTRRTVEHDVRQRYTSMQIVDQEYDVLRDREKAGEDILAKLTSQYEGGKQTNLQLIYANTRLFDARAARIDAYYRRLLARFELLNAMGRLRDALAPDAAAKVSTAGAR